MGDREDNTGDPRIPRHARAQTERSPKEREKILSVQTDTNDGQMC